MRESIITGQFNKSPILTHLFETEAAFLLRYPDHEIGVVFCKGIWQLAKVCGGVMTDTIGLEDSPGVVMEKETSAMAGGLLASLIALKQDGTFYYNECRGLPAAVLIAFIEIWGGHLDRIVEIKVLKPGRNTLFGADWEIKSDSGETLYRMI